jgi:hypothetical protein
MSDIKLSPDLLREVRQALERNDPGASDPGFALQYLAALMGYILGGEDATEAEKQGYFDDLTAFARHVMEDTIENIKRQQTAREQSAFGYWEPPAKG